MTTSIIAQSRTPSVSTISYIESRRFFRRLSASVLRPVAFGLVAYTREGCELSLPRNNSGREGKIDKPNSPIHQNMDALYSTRLSYRVMQV